MTVQVSERIVIDGKELSMRGEPELPKMHARIWNLDEIFCKSPDGTSIERPRPSELTGRATSPTANLFFSTACYRGYIGTWEIRDQFLYLTKLEGRSAEMIGDEPLMADWFTGRLWVDHGNTIRLCIIMGAIYETTQVIEVEAGRVVSNEFIQNK